MLGKTDDAIHHLQRTMDIQEFAAPEPRHVQTYLFLSRLHQRKGEHDEARRVLEEGLRRHPGDTGLEAARAKLDG